MTNRQKRLKQVISMKKIFYGNFYGKGKFYPRLIFDILCIFCLIYAAGALYNTFILPQALTVTKNAVIAYTNACINSCVQNAAAAEGNNIKNICDIKYGSDGKIMSIAADGMAVNRFCGNAAQELSGRLADGKSRVYIKLGSITGIPFLADKGPSIPVKISCGGSVTANYDTDIKSIGINQVSFCLFINIHADIRAYSPLINEITVFDRRIMLADIVYSGAVPNVVGAGISADY